MLIVYGRLLTDKIVREVEDKLAAHDVIARSVRRASKYGIMDIVRDGDKGEKPDVIILVDNEMPSGPYSAEEFVYMRYSRDVKVMPLLASDLRGTPFMRTLLQNGIYNAIFLRDTNSTNIAQLIVRGRNYNIAKDYYGV